MPASTSLSAAKLRFISVTVWAQVFLMPTIVTLLDPLGRQQSAPPAWLGTARLVAGALAVYGVLMPLLFVPFSQRVSSRIQERGVDPDRLRALVGMLGFGAPAVYGGLLGMLGDDARIAYLTALVSFLGLAYWSWRYRHVLWSGGA